MPFLANRHRAAHSFQPVSLPAGAAADEEPSNHAEQQLLLENELLTKRLHCMNILSAMLACTLAVFVGAAAVA